MEYIAVIKRSTDINSSTVQICRCVSNPLFLAKFSPAIADVLAAVYIYPWVVTCLWSLLKAISYCWGLLMSEFSSWESVTRRADTCLLFPHFPVPKFFYYRPHLFLNMLQNICGISYLVGPEDALYVHASSYTRHRHKTSISHI